MLTLGAALLVVVVVKPDPAPEQAQALEAACSDALEGTCTLQSNTEEQSPDAVAIVSVDAQRSQAIIQLGQGQRARQDWRRRTLDFAPEDESIERFRAIGLTIATMAGEAQQARDTVPRSDTTAAPTNSEPPPEAISPAPPPAEPPEAPRSFPWLVVAVSALGGPGLDQGPWRAGASVRSSLRFWSPPLEPTASASYAGMLGDHRGLRATWTRCTLGLSLAYTRWDVRTAAHVEGALEGLHALQREPADSGSRWVFGVMMGADVAWPASGLLGAYFHADLLSLEGGTTLTSGGERLASSPGNTYSLGVGVQLRLH